MPPSPDCQVRLSKPGPIRHVLIAPIGFLSDHLEVLYDVDIDFRRLAESQGMQLERMAMLNASPALITILASLLDEHQASLVA